MTQELFEEVQATDQTQEPLAEIPGQTQVLFAEVQIAVQAGQTQEQQL